MIASVDRPPVLAAKYARASHPRSGLLPVKASLETRTITPSHTPVYLACHLEDLILSGVVRTLQLLLQARLVLVDYRLRGPPSIQARRRMRFMSDRLVSHHDAYHRKRHRSLMTYQTQGWKLWGYMEMDGKRESSGPEVVHRLPVSGQPYMTQSGIEPSAQRRKNFSRVWIGKFHQPPPGTSLTNRYGFVNEPLRNRNETRIALIPTAPLLKIPKLPKVSPLAGVPAQPLAMNGPSDHEPKAPMMPTAYLGESEKHRRKERERVDKWMKMMKVTKRDQGGNILEWGWKMDGQGHKVSPQLCTRRQAKGL
jgi:hypothetical protein